TSIVKRHCFRSFATRQTGASCDCTTTLHFPGVRMRFELQVRHSSPLIDRWTLTTSRLVFSESTYQSIANGTDPWASRLLRQAPVHLTLTQNHTRRSSGD